MDLIRKWGSTSNAIRTTLRHSTTGQGLTGISSASTGLIVSTICDNEATPTVYSVAGGTIETIATLGTFAAPTATKCRLKEVDATNNPGMVELQFDDARFAVANAKTLRVTISGATNLLAKTITIQLQGVDVASVGRTDQTPGDIIGVLGTPSSTGPATIAHDIANVSTAITAGVAATLTATADRYTTDASANRVNSYTATFLSNGTNWITGPTTPAVAETGASGATAGSPFWLNVGLLYVSAANQYINSVTIRGFFSAGAARNCNVYAYNYVTKNQDQLSDATTRMATATTNQTYTYTLLSAHQKATSAVASTSAGSNFSAAGTTCTANVTGHGFTTGDIVTISGITTLTNANGTFMVTRVNDNQFTYPILSQTATGGGTASMTTDAIGSVRIGFKEGSTSSYNAADRLNIDQCVVNCASAGASAADIAAAVKQSMIDLYYPEGVWVDSVNGVAATVVGTNGIRTRPVTTLADAATIAGVLNLTAYSSKPGSTLTLDRSMVKTIMQGPGGWQLALGGQDISGATIRNCEMITGASTSPSTECYVHDSQIGTSAWGEVDFHRCHMMDATVTLVQDAAYLFDSIDFVPFSGTNIIDFNGSTGNRRVVIANSTGAVTIKNMKANNVLLLNGGVAVTLDSTCTAGTVYLLGPVKLTNNGSGQTILHDDESTDLSTILSRVTGTVALDSTAAKEATLTALLPHAIPMAQVGGTGAYYPKALRHDGGVIHEEGAAVAKSPATLAAADVTGNLPVDVQTIKQRAVQDVGAGNTAYVGTVAFPTSWPANWPANWSWGTSTLTTSDIDARLAAWGKTGFSLATSSIVTATFGTCVLPETTNTAAYLDAAVSEAIPSDTYWFGVEVAVENAAATPADVWTVSPKKNVADVPHGSASNVTLTVTDQAGNVLLNGVTMSEIGSTGVYSYTATGAAKMTVGKLYIAVPSATVDSGTRTGPAKIVGRDY